MLLAPPLLSLLSPLEAPLPLAPLLVAATIRLAKSRGDFGKAAAETVAGTLRLPNTVVATDKFAVDAGRKVVLDDEGVFAADDEGAFATDEGEFAPIAASFAVGIESFAAGFAVDEAFAIVAIVAVGAIDEGTFAVDVIVLDVIDADINGDGVTSASGKMMTSFPLTSF